MNSAPQVIAPPMTETARHYSSYGLRICSDIALPELAPAAPGPVDLVIRRAPLSLAPILTARPQGEAFSAEGVDLWWSTVGGFRLPHDSSEILVDALPDVDDDLLAFPLLGAVLALALHRRALFSLHASAVAVNGRGVVLMGDKGAGKSTTAASLLAAGHPLLADDTVVFDPDLAAMIPGFAQVKLAGAALAQLTGPDSRAPVEIRPPMPQPALSEKARVLLPGGLAPAPVAPGLICLLTRVPEQAPPRLRPLPPDLALKAVLTHAYVARFGTAALQGPALARHFRAASRLATSGALHVLEVPQGLSRLPDTVALIEQHLAGTRT